MRTADILGCHAYEGHLFSRLLPLDEFEAFMKSVRHTSEGWYNVERCLVARFAPKLRKASTATIQPLKSETTLEIFTY